jgi:hypothetical protein
MSYNAARWIFEQPITSTEKLVLLKLAHHAEPDGTKAYPSVDNIVRDTGIGKRQIQRYLKSFVERGFLSIDEHEKGGRGHTRTYSFTFAKGDTQTAPLYEENSDTQKSPIDEERVTFDDVKGDISGIERVTPETEKGDIHAGAKVNTQEHPIELPRTNTPKPPTKPKAELTEEQQRRFECWYSAYPRKVDKAKAVKAWMAIDPSDDLTDRMVAKVEEWAASESWQDVNFVPYPATWLNAERWTDGPPPPPKSKPGALTIHNGGRYGEKVGKDGLTDAERGWREDPGHKGWGSDELMRMALAMERAEAEAERNSA